MLQAVEQLLASLSCLSSILPETAMKGNCLLWKVGNGVKSLLPMSCCRSALVEGIQLFF